jgi:ribulose-phosphate 3-epimerase
MVDQVLIMSVEPGFGGQSFIPASIQKIRDLKALLMEVSPSTWLQVDGGISAENIQAVASAGVDTFVAGSAVFNSDNPAESIARLRELAILGAQAQ